MTQFLSKNKNAHLSSHGKIAKQTEVEKFLKLAKSREVRKGYKKMLKDNDATPETLPAKLREKSNREMQDDRIKNDQTNQNYESITPSQDDTKQRLEKEYGVDKEWTGCLSDEDAKIFEDVLRTHYKQSNAGKCPCWQCIIEAISKTKAYYQDNTNRINKKILPHGFKDADEEIAKLQDNHQNELESAVRRAKLETSAFHEKHLKEIIAKRDGQLYNCKQNTISEVFAELEKIGWAELNGFLCRMFIIPEVDYKKLKQKFKVKP